MVCFSSLSFGRAVSTGLVLSALAGEAASVISFHRYQKTSKNPPNAIAISRRKPPARTSLERRAETEDLSIFMDGVYTAQVTLGGTEYTVILDPGSADLWVDRAPTSGFTNKSIEMTFEYEVGNNSSLIVEGGVGTAPFTFGTYTIPEQAFVNIDAPDFHELTGVNGIMGLGLDRTSSAIDKAVKDTEGEDAEWGASVLSNIFEADGEHNFVSLNLARSEDGEDTAGGSITVGDYDSEYADVVNQPKINVYPEGATRWTVLMDRISVDFHHISLNSSIQGVPDGKAVALVSTDIGSAGYLPEPVFTEIYSTVSGAVPYEDPVEGLMYIVPCNASMKVSYTFGSHHYPLHPLDLTMFWETRPDSLKDYTVCVSTIRGIKAGSKSDHDLIVGGAFLKNVYTIFDFGDYEGGSTTMGPPYIQFLSHRAHEQGHEEFLLHRNMEGRPEELPPSQVLSMISGHQSDSTNAGKTKPSQKSNHGSGNKEANAKTDSTSGSNTANADSASASGETVPSNGGWSRFMPAIIALLAVNLLVGLVLTVLGVLNYIKKNGASKANGVPHYIPVSKTADGQHTIIFDSDARASNAEYSLAGRKYGDA